MALGLIGGLLGGGLGPGLDKILFAGQLQMAQAGWLQLENIATNMYTSQLTNMANQQKTMMDAASGIGQAYSNGSAGIYQSIMNSNQEMGNVFKKAGGH